MYYLIHLYEEQSFSRLTRFAKDNNRNIVSLFTSILQNWGWNNSYDRVTCNSKF